MSKDPIIYSVTPATLGDGDQAQMRATSKGALVVALEDSAGNAPSPFPTPATPWSYAAAASGIVNTTTAVTIKSAGAAGVRNYVSAIQIMWEALTTASEIAIRDGAAGTVLWRAKIPATLAGAREIVFPVPLKGTAATLLEFLTLTASGAGAVYFDAQGYSV